MRQVIEMFLRLNGGFLAAGGIAMLIGSLTFFLLKDKCVVSPEGRPIGGLPSKEFGK